MSNLWKGGFNSSNKKLNIQSSGMKNKKISLKLTFQKINDGMRMRVSKQNLKMFERGGFHIFIKRTIGDSHFVRHDDDINQ